MAIITLELITRYFISVRDGNNEHATYYIIISFRHEILNLNKIELYSARFSFYMPIDILNELLAMGTYGAW